MTAKRRIGIYGGTFSPPHIGHIAAARAMLAALPIDLLYVIPTAEPPHKELSYAIDPRARLALTEIAFRDIPRCEVSDLEICRGGRSYTSDTLRSLASDEVELYLLCGTDMMLTLEYWHEARTIFSLATIVYVRRECDEATEKALRQKEERYRSEFGARVIALENPVIEISSERLREMLKTAPEAAGEYLPEGVLSYIEREGLYGL